MYIIISRFVFYKKLLGTSASGQQAIQVDHETLAKLKADNDKEVAEIKELRAEIVRLKAAQPVSCTGQAH
ncbi:MAG: hypothetical protein P4L58_00870 [Candidatus Pacebacteria bacterium]|nr:hypothetical protein [Candidatus Paceibacterota bacterium]